MQREGCSFPQPAGATTPNRSSWYRPQLPEVLNTTASAADTAKAKQIAEGVQGSPGPSPVGSRTGAGALKQREPPQTSEREAECGTLPVAAGRGAPRFPALTQNSAELVQPWRLAPKLFNSAAKLRTGRGLLSAVQQDGGALDHFRKQCLRTSASAIL